MRNIIHRLQTFGLYLLPAGLLMLCGVLLTVLLHSPAPPVRSVSEPPSSKFPDLAQEEYWRSHAEEMFMMLLADALRQSQVARETQARTLMYRLPSAGNPHLLRMPPYPDENDQTEYPILIKL